MSIVSGQFLKPRLAKLTLDLCHISNLFFENADPFLILAYAKYDVKERFTATPQSQKLNFGQAGSVIHKLSIQGAKVGGWKV